MRVRPARANRRRPATRGKHPQAVSARYVGGKVRIQLSNGAEFAFPPSIAQGLEQATPNDLAVIEVSPSGLGLHFPSLDADLYLPGLLEGVFGTMGWTAAQLGQTGGAAARTNGKLGGRPRKAREVA